MRPETRQSIVLVFGMGATTLLSLLYTSFAARTLGTVVAADYFAAVSLVAFCQIALGPINATVAKFSADYFARGEMGRVRALSRHASRWVAVYGVLLAVPALVLIRPLARMLNFASVWPLFIALGMVYVTMLLSVVRGVLRGVQDFGNLNANMILEAGVRLGLGVMLLSSWATAPAGLCAFLAGLIVTVVWAYARLWRTWRRHPVQDIDIKAIRGFTGPMWILLFITAGYQNLDMLAVKYQFAAEEAGLYGAVFSIVRWVSAMVTPFNILLLPLLTTLHSQGRGVSGTFLRICLYCTLMVAGPLVLFAMFPERIVVWLCGPKYAAGGGLLFSLSVARFLGHVSQMIGLAFAATNRFRFLYLYFAGLVFEAATLVVFHDSLTTVVSVVFAAQGATLLGMIAFWAFGTRFGRRRQPSSNTAPTGAPAS